MWPNLMVLATMLGSGPLVPPNDLSARATLSFAAAAAAQPELDAVFPTEGLSISRQNWLREGGFLIAEITFINKNEFAVRGAIIACDFFDPPDMYIGRRGSLIVGPIPPGETTIGGIEFTMLKHNVFHPHMFGGVCSVASDASAIW